MLIKTYTYKVELNSGTQKTFYDIQDALSFCVMLGYHSHYRCDDGRTFIYRDDQERDADTNGGGERGAIEEIEEIEEIFCDAEHTL